MCVGVCGCSLLSQERTEELWTHDLDKQADTCRPRAPGSAQKSGCLLECRRGHIKLQEQNSITLRWPGVIVAGHALASSLTTLIPGPVTALRAQTQPTLAALPAGMHLLFLHYADITSSLRALDWQAHSVASNQLVTPGACLPGAPMGDPTQTLHGAMSLLWPSLNFQQGSEKR